MRYLKNIKNKIVKSFKSFGKKEKVEIQASDIDDLVDIFTEFGELGFELKELSLKPIGGYKDSEKYDYTLLTVSTWNATEGDLLYYKEIFKSDDYPIYVPFILYLPDQLEIEEVQKIADLTNDIYNRILYIGYNCDVTIYDYISGKNGPFIVFRIGSDFFFNNYNDLTKHNLVTKYRNGSTRNDSNDDFTPAV